MVTNFAVAARLLPLALCASLALGCGIKGPLKPPPKPEPAKSGAPATPDVPAKPEAPAQRSP